MCLAVTAAGVPCGALSDPPEDAEIAARITSIFLVSLYEGNCRPRVSARVAGTAAGDLLPALKPAFFLLPSRPFMRVPAATWPVIPEGCGQVHFPLLELAVIVQPIA